MAIESCKGHVHVFADDGSEGSGQSTGFYDIEPSIPDADDSKVLVLGIPLEFQEIVQPSTTLDDKRTLKVFGAAWNNISLSGIMLLGESSTRGDQLTKLIQWYNENRVSVKQSSVRVSLGTTGIDAYVVGLRLDQADAKTNSQMFSIVMLTADVET